VKKRYQAIKWTELPLGEQRRYLDWLEAENLPYKKRKVWCKVCNAVLWESISHEYWKTRLTVKEQRHVDSEQHQQGLFLQRLGDG